MPFQPFASDWDRAAWSGSEQWTWLAVEITEIRRCASAGDQAHDRLAFLLVDHLVEVIVGREVNTRLAMQPADSVIDEIREARNGGHALSPELDKLINEHVGPEQRNRLDAHLHEKTKYLMKFFTRIAVKRELISIKREIVSSSPPAFPTTSVPTRSWYAGDDGDWVRPAQPTMHDQQDICPADYLNQICGCY